MAVHSPSSSPIPGSKALAGLSPGLSTKLDPLGWGEALATVTGRALTRPGAVASATVQLVAGAAQVPFASMLRSISVPVPGPVEPDPKDKRFTDTAWQENAGFYALRQLYELARAYVDDVLDAGADGNDLADQKARMAAHFVVDALAPTNFPLTNPDALVTAWQTGGLSLVRGGRLAVEDLLERRGMPLKVDTSGFRLGENLAHTPGKVIFRNDLIELIQYAPQTDQVHEVPILCSPPWINRYYVMDLAPERSFVEWAVQHGRTVFMISYRNPDDSMRDTTMDDYLEHGPLAALDVVQAITGAPKVDLVALCLGGALAAMTAGYLAADGKDRIGSMTLLNTLLDYSIPGELGTMVDPATLERVEARMAEHGYLPAADMATTFDLLRAQDLIFRYIPSRWLKGEQPSAFDILAWNEDSTRMPAAMHSSYLRDLYGKNLLALGDFEISGRHLDLSKVEAPTYVVGAINDHIVPWEASYATAHLMGGPVRYVLSSGGHIAGIVNPPSPKAWYHAGEGTAYPEDPAVWREDAPRVQGSWWEDWAQWSTAQAGKLVKPPKMGSRKYRPLADAPGEYVRE